MCDLHDRLVEHARALGARNVRIKHGGARGGPRRYRRHPHLTGEINGVVFAFPIKSRPRDATHGYRQRYLRTLQAYRSKSASCRHFNRPGTARRPRLGGAGQPASAVVPRAGPLSSRGSRAPPRCPLASTATPGHRSVN
jgi:hypothetical protein